MVAKRVLLLHQPYSEIEGFQLAHTHCFTAPVHREGIVLECGGSRAGDYTSRVICPVGDFWPRDALMRYLCENGIGSGHWLDVLDDAGRCTGPARLKWAAGGGRGFLRDLYHLPVLIPETWCIIQN